MLYNTFTSGLNFFKYVESLLDFSQMQVGISLSTKVTNFRGSFNFIVMNLKKSHELTRRFDFNSAF